MNIQTLATLFMNQFAPATNPPRLFGGPVGSALFKSRFEDFQVEEVLGFEPSGEGEHCLLWIEKTDRNTNDVATELARKLGIRKRLVSHCGLKDKHAVTRQWFSVHLPGQDSPPAASLESTGTRVLRVTRHRKKIRRGIHVANRFSITLRECNFSKSAAQARLQEMTERGVPNYFGPQRFGHDGGNLKQACRFMVGELDVKDRLLRGILISSARSLVFNACVAQRVEDRSWDVPLDGEVFGFPDNHSLVLPGNLRGDETARVKSGALELTAPLWGKGQPPSQGQVCVLEKDVAKKYADITTGLAQFNLSQERRVIRLKPSNLEMSWKEEQEASESSVGGSTMLLQFDLPKGTYATTLLRELVALKS